MTLALFLAFLVGLSLGLFVHGIWWPLAGLGLAGMIFLGVVLAKIPTCIQGVIGARERP